ncbi:MAG: hypothetical protein U0271_19930 [Polyangiaceae bacterium]
MPARPRLSLVVLAAAYVLSGCARSATPAQSTEPEPVRIEQPPATPSPEPGPPPKSDQKGVKMGDTGVTGLVVRLEGDFMPPTPPGYQGTRTPIACRVFVFRGAVKPFSEPNTKHPALVTIVNTDAEGRYAVDLEPGVYTAVAELNGKLYYNGYGGDGTWSSFTVKKGAVTSWPITDNSLATY